MHRTLRHHAYVILLSGCLFLPVHTQNKPDAKVEALAARLIAAQSEDERQTMLAAEKELVTESLVQELIAQGTRLTSEGKYEEAITRHRLARSIAERINDQAGMALALHRTGNVYYSRGDFDSALALYQKSLTLSEALGDKALASRALNNIGAIHQRQGNHARALEQYQKSLTLSEELGDKTGVSSTLYNIGFVYESQSRYAQALEQYQKSLMLSEALGDKAVASRTLGSMGGIHSSQGNYAQAIEYYQKSLALSEALEDKVGVSRMLVMIGLIYSKQGNYAQALEQCQKSLALNEALGNKAGVSVALNNIGEVHRQQRNYAQALDHYQKSLALSEALGNKALVGMALGNIGIVHSRQSNYAQALEYFQKSLALSEELGNKAVVGNALGNIGLVHFRQGNYTEALEYFEKTLALFEALGDKPGVSMTLSKIGIVHSRQGRYEPALEYFQKSLTLSEALGDKALVNETLTAAGRSYRALNQLIPARQAFEKAIATIETLRVQVAGGEQEQQRFFEDKLASYQAMVELLVAQNQAGAALAYAERAKARALLDVLQSGRINVTKAMTTAEEGRERELTYHLVSLNTQISRANLGQRPDPARISDLQAQLQKARLEYEAFQTSLYAAHPELKSRRGQAELLTLDEARALLPDARSALLEYVVTDERTYLFALTGSADEVKVYPLEIKRKDLSERIARFRETLAQGGPGFREPARALYDLLLKPAAAQLRGKTALLIVPDDALWELPFQALQPAPTRYLLDDCAIAYAPSLTALREMSKPRGGKKDSASSPTLLAFGNPALGRQTVARARSVLMDEKLDPLPEAERQVNVMRQIYGAAKSKVYTGAEAREERAKAEAGGYRILHLATHGILNDSSPMYSHVLLAQAEGANSEDGLLEAWEIMKLDLNADLTVLSACETARGRVGAGEGMIGLSWALFVAGCPASVVSQWKVDSASTTELMLEFHRRLKSQMANPAVSFSPSRALREAALKLRRTGEYRHPFYWAGFVATGKGF